VFQYLWPERAIAGHAEAAAPDHERPA
jgi:hypothetical protein